ncbi:MAG TPA: type VI secretion system tube protein TssD [Puia sp.]|nr:type VI secretion system tube protein TssD [Puia sp.]
MSTVMNLTIEGNLIPINTFLMNFFRKISEDTSLPTSSILGGTVDLTMMFEAESDSNTFFASWFQEPGKTHDVDIDVFHLAGTGDKFLTMKLASAQCVQYNVSHKVTEDPSSPEENSILEIVLASPSITIGQATLKTGS